LKPQAGGVKLTTSIPGPAVIRVSRGNFDPANFTEVERMTGGTGSYLIPAIRDWTDCSATT
jgi:hypothetical protein